jgi:hypothetical protein
MEIAKTDLKGFERVTRKYGVDYAIRKDPSQDPPRYIVFFKLRYKYQDVLPRVDKKDSSLLRASDKRHRRKEAVTRSHTDNGRQIK